MRRIAPIIIAIFVSGVVLAPPQATAAPDVDLELVLAVDISRSMDAGEQQLQRDGYAAAFLHPDIVAAIHSGPLGRIAVTYVEWAGVGLNSVIVPWTVVESADDAAAFAARLSATRPSSASRTSISSALVFGAELFGTAHTGYRRAIDVSGDGANNAGARVDLTRDRIAAEGITINGLPIMLHTGGPFFTPNLDAYYKDCVIGGPGAFIVPVRHVEEFALAIRRKLVLEIAGLPMHVVPAADVAAEPPTADCLIGERQWRGLWNLGPGR